MNRPSVYGAIAHSNDGMGAYICQSAWGATEPVSLIMNPGRRDGMCHCHRVVAADRATGQLMSLSTNPSNRDMECKLRNLIVPLRNQKRSMKIE